MPRAHRLVLLLAFAASGFSALVYETVWSQYLRLLLGHAAYAQTAVVVLFMGGMALGAAWAGRRSARLARPLRAYAIAEALAGLAALAFHPAFLEVQALVGRLGPGAAWALGAPLVLLPAGLLGATFPLLSAGLARLDPVHSGRTVALLYGVNSLGAVAGCLAAGFLLVARLGLPGSLAFAAAVSLAAAAALGWIDRGLAPAPPLPATPHAAPPAAAGAAGPAPDAPGQPAPALLLLVAFATGAASFAYEMGWIRMLALLLGSSVHAFELMLAAFILGLGLGGLAVRTRLDGAASPVRILAVVQVLMGALAAASLPLHGTAVDLAAWLRTTLPRTDTGWLLYALGSHGVALLVMLPATFCAGMTLPLLTRAMLDAGRGERSVGAVYAANTVGGILGVVVAVHLGFEAVGVKGVVLGGAALDVLAGLALAWAAAAPTDRRPRWRPLAARASPALVGWAMPVAVVALVALTVRIDPLRAASGVFRTGAVLDPPSFRVLFARDGRTASVSVVEGLGGERSFRTNGKSDAALTPTFMPASGDEPTMVLLGALPLAIHPGARRAAVIGLGSGLTSHTLLSDPWLERVDTIEIEPAMVEAARGFSWPTLRVFSDPRGAIHLADARSFFAGRPGAYNVIVSEPSNPWISGVSGLFSREFYASARAALARDGVFVQWLQVYEIDLPLVLSILRALDAEFQDWQVFSATDGDLIVVARAGPLPTTLAPRRLLPPPMAELLAREDLHSVRDLEARRLATGRSLAGLLAGEGLPANGDFAPVVEQEAPRQMYLGATMPDLVRLASLPVPFVDVLTWGRPIGTEGPLSRSQHAPITEEQADAQALARALGGASGAEAALTGLVGEERAAEARRVVAAFTCAERLEEPELLDAMWVALSPVLVRASQGEQEALWQRLDAGRCAPGLGGPVATWSALYRAVGRRDSAGMAREAGRLLDDGGRTYSGNGLKFLVASAMLGAIGSGHPAEALTRWERHGTSVSGGGRPGLLFRLLLGEAAGQATLPAHLPAPLPAPQEAR
jgi:predicted membrane-bound spermidine synthase